VDSRERINLALDHRPADRVAIQDAPWGTTLERWRREGLPAEVTPADYFHYELAGYWPDLTTRFPAELREETDEYEIHLNSWGVQTKTWKHRASVPQWLSYTLQTRADWEEHKHRMVWDSNRVDWEAARQAQAEARARGQWFHFTGAFGYNWIILFAGDENLLMAMASEPEWAQDMFDTCGQLLCDALEDMIGHGFEFDGCFIYDDMGYRGGPLFSPAMFRRYEFPNHQRFYQLAKSHGLKTILHSCGNVTALIPGLIEAGLSCLQPLEVKAGMDLLQLKQDYGEVLSFMGGIDARKMAHPDPTVIEEEIRTKVTAAKQNGGYIFHSDHSIPDDVSFEQYCRVVELAKKYGSYE
jgi:uroporphyrinogen decarboxylase